MATQGTASEDEASGQLLRSSSSPGRSPASGALRLIRQASSRRFLREPSARVREAAGEQVEERQSDLAYSWPVVILDLIWNFGFIASSLVVIALSLDERPSAPLRLWIFGYAAQCCVHMVCVWSEYQRRQELRRANVPGSRNPGNPGPADPGVHQASFVSSGRRPDGALSEALLRQRRSQEDVAASARAEQVGGDRDAEAGAGRGRRAGPVRAAEEDQQGDANGGDGADGDADVEESVWDRSLARQIESVNTIFSFVWWVVGLGWLISTFDDTFQDSPLLSWLCMIFLAFDVFFVVFCTALACVIGLAVCCCLPCIIAVLYAVGGKDGASTEAIEALPQFKFRKSASVKSSLSQLMTRSPSTETALAVDEQHGGYIVPVDAAEGAKGRPVASDDAECCICLSTYDDGALLRELPCGHHFDQACLDKWLRTKPTCPLCKYDIMRRGRSTSDTLSSPGQSIAAQQQEDAQPLSLGGAQAPPSLVTAIQTSTGFFPSSSSQS